MSEDWTLLFWAPVNWAVTRLPVRRLTSLGTAGHVLVSGFPALSMADSSDKALGNQTIALVETIQDLA